MRQEQKRREGSESVEIIGGDNLRRQMGKNKARDNGWTAEIMAGERQETERSRDGVRDLRAGV